MEAFDLVDEVIVATDSDDIWNTVEARHYKKTTLYLRMVEHHVITEYFVDEKCFPYAAATINGNEFGSLAVTATV